MEESLGKDVDSEFYAVISSLQPGGAEHTFVEVVREATKLFSTVTVITLQESTKNELELPEGATRISLGFQRQHSGMFSKGCAFLRLLKELRHALPAHRGAVVLSFMTQTNVLVLCVQLFRRARVIVCERVHPGFSPFLGTKRTKFIMKWIRDLFYLHAESVVVQSSSMQQAFSSALQARVRVIPNFVRSFPLQHGKQPRNPLILCIGRMVPQKDQLTALFAFHQVAAEYPDWKLRFIGDGPQREVLSHRIEALGLEKQVELCHISTKLEEEYQLASILLSTSRFEGFPNVILEALHFGLPVVATDCPGATGELIQNGKNGLLSPIGDKDRVARSLKKLIEDSSLRQQLGESARKSVERFQRDRVISEWRDLFRGEKREN